MSFRYPFFCMLISGLISTASYGAADQKTDTCGPICHGPVDSLRRFLAVLLPFSQPAPLIESQPDPDLWHPDNFEIKTHYSTGIIYFRNILTGDTSVFQEDNYYFDRRYDIIGCNTIRDDLSIDEASGRVTDDSGREYEYILGCFSPVKQDRL